MAVGLPPGKMSTDIFSVVVQKVTIKGSYVGNRFETEEAIDVMIKAGFRVQYRVFDFSELSRAYDMMENGMI